MKRAKWNKIEVAVKFFVSADRKGGFSEEVWLLGDARIRVPL